MENLKFNQLTELTGYRYNMFGKMLEHVGRDEEQRELIKANKDKVVNFEIDEECEKWIKEIEIEVDLGKKSIELTTYLYQNSIKNCIASTVLFIIALLSINWSIAMLFLLPVLFFLIRVINLIKSYRIQCGFLNMGIWILKENIKKTYNPSSSVDFNIHTV